MCFEHAPGRARDRWWCNALALELTHDEDKMYSNMQKSTHVYVYISSLDFWGSIPVTSDRQTYPCTGYTPYTVATCTSCPTPAALTRTMIGILNQPGTCDMEWVWCWEACILYMNVHRCATVEHISLFCFKFDHKSSSVRAGSRWSISLDQKPTRSDALTSFPVRNCRQIYNFQIFRVAILVAITLQTSSTHMNINIAVNNNRHLRQNNTNYALSKPMGICSPQKYLLSKLVPEHSEHPPQSGAHTHFIVQGWAWVSHHDSQTASQVVNSKWMSKRRWDWEIFSLCLNFLPWRWLSWWRVCLQPCLMACIGKG